MSAKDYLFAFGSLLLMAIALSALVTFLRPAQPPTVFVEPSYPILTGVYGGLPGWGWNAFPPYRPHPGPPKPHPAPPPPAPPPPAPPPPAPAPAPAPPPPAPPSS